MKRYQKLFEIGILLFAISVSFIPMSSYAYDPRLDTYLSSSYSEDIPADILSTLKENFPGFLIDNSDYNSQIMKMRPSCAWKYALADLDGIGENNYLVVNYSNGIFNTLEILKKLSSSYQLLWTSAFDPGWGGIGIVDLNNNNKPNITIDYFGASGRIDSKIILSWNSHEARLLNPCSLNPIKVYTSETTYVTLNIIKNNQIVGEGISYIDINRDGKLELVVDNTTYDSEGNKTGTKIEVFSWEGTGFVNTGELQTDSFINATVSMQPDKWNLNWLREEKERKKKGHDMKRVQNNDLCLGKDDDKSEGCIKVYIGNLADGHTVDEIKLNSIRLNEKLAPADKAKIKTDRDKEGKSFKGKYLEVKFDKYEAIGTILEQQEEDFKIGDKFNIKVSGQLNNSKLFIGACEIELEGRY